MLEQINSPLLVEGKGSQPVPLRMLDDGRGTGSVGTQRDVQDHWPRARLRSRMRPLGEVGSGRPSPVGPPQA